MEKISKLTDHKTVGVFLSGGLDSAVLAYLALELLPDTKLVLITGIHKHMDYYNKPYAVQVKTWLDNKFPNRILDHIILEYDNREHAKQYKKQNNEAIVKQYNIDALFSGMTLNPINEPSLMIEGRDVTRDTPLRYEHDYLGIKHYMPFNELDKKGIYELYKFYDVLELAEQTISCESETKTKPCKECWWCKEKHWAFNAY